MWISQSIFLEKGVVAFYKSRVDMTCVCPQVYFTRCRMNSDISESTRDSAIALPVESYFLVLEQSSVPTFSCDQISALKNWKYVFPWRSTRGVFGLSHGICKWQMLSKSRDRRLTFSFLFSSVCFAGHRDLDFESISSLGCDAKHLSNLFSPYVDGNWLFTTSDHSSSPLERSAFLTCD